MKLASITSACSIAVLLSTSTLHAASSDVADAVMRGDRAAVRALLARRVDVNAPQADGATALHWAAHREDIETTDLLLKAGANVMVANREGATPFSLACLTGNAALVDRFLRSGADPNERWPGGETPLMMASRAGSIGVMTRLLDRGADVNAREVMRGTTALMWAAAEFHPAAVQLLVSRGADMGARSNPAPRGRTPYVAPNLEQRLGDPKPPPYNALGASAEFQPNRDIRTLDGGGLTALVYAARQNDLESAGILINAGADINQVTLYGWSPLLVATQNRNYKLASLLLDRGADPNVVNKGGWNPLYLAVDNRNIEGGDYPVRKPDMDHLEFIKALVAHGANVNARLGSDLTWTRSVFTNQWLHESGATPFLRAAQSSDLDVMRLLIAHGADPKMPTLFDVSALHVAAGVGWVDGITYEWSERANLEAVTWLLDLGLDPNLQNNHGLTPLHGAAHKGRNAVVQLLVDRGSRLDTRDFGIGHYARLLGGGPLAGHTWLPIDYADGLVSIGTQSPVAHPETSLLIRRLMKERGMPDPPPPGRTVGTVCEFEACGPAAGK